MASWLETEVDPPSCALGRVLGRMEKNLFAHGKEEGWEVKVLLGAVGTGWGEGCWGPGIRGGFGWAGGCGSSRQ